MAVMWTILLLCSAALALPTHNTNFQPMIDYVNSLGTTWKAGHNYGEGMTWEYLKAQCGTFMDDPNLKLMPVQEHHGNTNDIPENFDARQKWGEMCPSTLEVRDQGACGSCWAFGATEAMTDRVCIHSKGAEKPHISADDLLSCCGFFTCGMGCNGGYPSGAWSYFKSHGIVTGGQYNSSKGCRPYEVASCDHHVKGKRQPCGPDVETPRCKRKCIEGYNVSYSDDKHYGASTYHVQESVSQIQQEIMTNGPVEGAFTVYADFPTYKSGVYQHTSGSALGGHAIKILGWGVEQGTPYWLVANSWNEDWGDKGFFKILRGENHCGIEGQIVAGLPK